MGKPRADLTRQRGDERQYSQDRFIRRAEETDRGCGFQGKSGEKKGEKGETASQAAQVAQRGRTVQRGKLGEKLGMRGDLDRLTEALGGLSTSTLSRHNVSYNAY